MINHQLHQGSKPYTLISTPDYKRFNTTGLTDAGIMKKRAYGLACTGSNVAVHFNDNKIDCKTSDDTVIGELKQIV